MSKAYLDNPTGKWKWGRNGSPKHDSKEQAEKAGLMELVDRLRSLKAYLNNTISNNGK